MKIIYEAFDGKQFYTREGCERYEDSFHLKDACKITFFDIKDNPYTIDPSLPDDEDIYDNAEKVIIHNENELKGFLTWAKDCGWCEFYDFDSPGIWIRHCGPSIFSDGYWTLEE